MAERGEEGDEMRGSDPEGTSLSTCSAQLYVGSRRGQRVSRTHRPNHTDMFARHSEPRPLELLHRFRRSRSVPKPHPEAQLLFGAAGGQRTGRERGGGKAPQGPQLVQT